MNTYEKGETVINRVAFKNLAGVAVDPSALTVRVKDPLGAVTVFTFGTDPEVVKESDGNYYVAVDPEVQGVWIVKWRATGANKGAQTDRFSVEEDYFD